MTSLIYFPQDLMRETANEWNLGGAVMSGGQTLSGVFPVVSFDGGGVWQASLTGIALDTPELRRLWRTVSAAADNGVTPIVVPRHDETALMPITASLVPHSDGSIFSDGTEYSTPGISATALVTAALRATTVHAHFSSYPFKLQAGQYFSILHATQGWRLYLITQATDEGGNNFALKITPPLREGVNEGGAIEFAFPRCVMRLAKPMAMPVRVEWASANLASVSFIEHFYTP